MFSGVIEDITYRDGAFVSSTLKSAIVPIQGGETYTISITTADTIFTSTTSDYPSVGVATVDAYAGSGGVKVNKKTLSTNANAKYLVIGFGSGVDAHTDEIMVNKGNTALPLEKYSGGEASPNMNYQQPLNSHGDSGSIVGKVLTSQFFDAKTSFASQIDAGLVTVNDDGSVTLNGTFNYENWNFYISLPVGTYYFIELQSILHQFASGSDGLWDGNRPITLTEETSFMCYINKGTYDNVTIYPMISTSYGAEFEPYTEQPFTALTPNGLKGIPLGKTIPSDIASSPNHMSGVYWDSKTEQYWIGDTVEYENGKYVQRIFETIIDDTSGVFDYVYPLEDTNIFGVAVDGITQNAPILCDRLIDCTNWGIARNGIHTNANNRIVFRLKDELTGITSEDSSYQKVTKVNALLAEKPLVVQYYSINEPIETDLTQEEMAQYNALIMNKGNNTLLNDAGAMMELEQVCDTKMYIDNLEKKHNEDIQELKTAIIALGGTI